MIATINPATDDLIQTFEPHDDEEIDRRLSAAVVAQRRWRVVPVAERVLLLRRIAEVLRANADDYARLITFEMGKPIIEAEAEVEKCAVTLDYYAEHAPAFLADEPVASAASDSRILFEPLGVVLAIMPWNYPFWQFFRFAAPALAAGNGAILKHASNVPQSALAIEQILAAAGAPTGLFASIFVEPERIGGLIDDTRIAAVTLTGSTEVGRIVAARAGAAIKKQVLELGGSDPFVVLADADIELAAATAVRARFVNGGQSCVNAKRFIVEAVVADRFVDLFTQGVRALVLGDPLDRVTDIGPLARPHLRDTLHRQVLRSIEAGAVLVTGGRPASRAGYFYEPTVLDHVTPGHAVFDEEIFGPVAAIIRVKDADEAIELANQTEFGLAAAIWSRDVDRAIDLGRRIEAGAVFVNGMVASDARLPFGGIKASGYGRELGEFGIREFVNIKTLWVGPARAEESGKR